MANCTLYVTGEDEQAWEDAKSLSDGGAESLSKLAAEGLRLVVAQRAAVARFGQELRGLGWEQAGAAFRLHGPVLSMARGVRPQR